MVDNEWLKSLLESHGHEWTEVDEIIYPNFRESIGFKASFTPQEIQNNFSSRLDLAVYPNSDQEPLYECFGDVGESNEEAVKNNIQNFAQSSFHVLTSAFNLSEESDYCLEEEWTIGKNRFSVFIGNIITKQTGKSNIEIPENFLREIERIMTSFELNGDLFFVRFYISQINKAIYVTEFMINNNRIEPAEQELAQLDWLLTDDFYSKRMFMVIKPANSKLKSSATPKKKQSFLNWFKQKTKKTH